MMGAEQGGWQARGGVLAALSASKKDVLIDHGARNVFMGQVAHILLART